MDRRWQRSTQPARECLPVPEMDRPPPCGRLPQCRTEYTAVCASGCEMRSPSACSSPSDTQGSDTDPHTGTLWRFETASSTTPTKWQVPSSHQLISGLSCIDSPWSRVSLWPTHSCGNDLSVSLSCSLRAHTTNVSKPIAHGERKLLPPSEDPMSRRHDAGSLVPVDFIAQVTGQPDPFQMGICAEQAHGSCGSIEYCTPRPAGYSRATGRIRAGPRGRPARSLRVLQQVPGYLWGPESRPRRRAKPTPVPWVNLNGTQYSS